MRILSIAHILQFVKLHAVGQREGFALITVKADRTQIVADSGVVLCRMGEYLAGQVIARGVAQSAAVMFEFIKNARIILAVDDHADVGMILRRRTQHGGAANIDIFDRRGQTAAGLRNRFLKRIKINHNQIDRKNSMLFHYRVILSAPAKQATMDFRMQGLDSAGHDFRKAGIFGNLDHFEAGFAQ